MFGKFRKKGANKGEALAGGASSKRGEQKASESSSGEIKRTSSLENVATKAVSLRETSVEKASYYQAAALKANRGGNTSRAAELMKQARQYKENARRASGILATAQGRTVSEGELSALDTTIKSRSILRFKKKYWDQKPDSSRSLSSR